MLGKPYVIELDTCTQCISKETLKKTAVGGSPSDEGNGAPHLHVFSRLILFLLLFLTLMLTYAIPKL